MNLDALDISILGPAFAAGLLVLVTHVPLGRIVLARGIIFIDLAVAQIAGLGVIAAHSLGWEANPWAIQAIAALAALLGSAGLYLLGRYLAQVQEALIGVTFVLAATAGILLLAHNPHGGEHLKELLSGQILWVSWQQLLPVALIYLLLISTWILLRKRANGIVFYLVFALSVTLSVQLIGVYLVFASLIIPALSVRELNRNKGLALGWLVGVLGYAAGLTASALWDLPSGPLIVWTLAASGLLVWTIRRAVTME
ncbi:MAG: metal ABC transporter permease [gamma proteobacterium symbiont of Bathyaustriella thionipta]|nr:metal ABC transporter permease [gamma proteobacterium symbiont of Bathyaustriella thionipta]